MNINTDKICFCKIVPKKEQLKVTKYRNTEIGETDENLRLIEDEVKGIISNGTGWCFYKHQLEAIKEKLKEKLSPEIFKTFNCKFDGYCFTITIKRPRKKYTRKDSVVEAEEIEENFPKPIIEETTTEEETVIEPKSLNLGSFTVTAYCCCKICCGKEPEHPAYGITASGKRATEGRTIAVDPSVIPLGTTVYLNDVPYVAEDTGSAIKGKKIDLFINDHQRAKVFGVQEMEVKI